MYICTHVQPPTHPPTHPRIYNHLGSRGAEGGRRLRVRDSLFRVYGLERRTGLEVRDSLHTTPTSTTQHPYQPHNTHINRYAITPTSTDMPYPIPYPIYMYSYINVFTYIYIFIAHIVYIYNIYIYIYIMWTSVHCIQHVNQYTFMHIPVPLPGISVYIIGHV
jgi:hypothetical protein